jgi:hypothetical protein
MAGELGIIGGEQGDGGRVAAQPVQVAARAGPMLPTAMPSLALILAYDTGGSAVSMVISLWPARR